MQMNSRSLGILIALVVIVASASVWLSMSRHEPVSTRGALYPDLKRQLDAVTAVRIYGAGNARKVELTRDGNEWRVTERFNYPVAMDKLRQLLIGLSDARIVEEKTSNAANYALLGVEDVSAADATAVRVQLAGTAKPTDLLIGKAGSGTSSRYVRRANEKTSWLIDHDLNAPTQPQHWLRPELIDLSADRIQAAHIEIAGKQAYTAAKQSRADANFAVSDLKRGQALDTEAAPNSVATALANLHLDDVTPHSQFQDQQPTARAKYSTFDGVVIELTGWTAGALHYVHLRAAYDESLAQRFMPQRAGETATPANPKSSAPNVRDDTTALDARLEPWVFQIADYKYTAIFQPLDELLKKEGTAP
jgi:hypothetical protein